MEKIICATCVALSILTSGCTSLSPKGAEVKVVSLSLVLDAVKDEINAYRNMRSGVPVAKSVCNPAGEPNILRAKEISVTLETASFRKSEPAVALIDPLGVISFAPSFSGSYSKNRTQILVVPLVIDDETSETKVSPGEIAVAIAQFRDELLKVDHNKRPCLGSSSKAIMLTLAFDVISQSEGSFTLKLVPFKFGDKETFGEESHQKLQLTFELAGPVLLVQ